MSRLPLDDPRWRGLRHRDGTTHPDVARELTALVEAPDDLQRFTDLWPYLCSEGTTWEAAFAAAPYLVECARRLPPARRTEYLVVLGLFKQTDSEALGDPRPIEGLTGGYEEAMRTALTLLTETLLEPHSAEETRYLLAAAAAFKGHPRLGIALTNLDIDHADE